MAIRNHKNIGSSLDSFLKAEGILEKTQTVALKRILAYQLIQILKQEGLTQTELARRMNTSKAAVNRLLNPENPSITLNTLAKAAQALGKQISFKLEEVLPNE